MKKRLAFASILCALIFVNAGFGGENTVTNDNIMKKFIENNHAGLDMADNDDFSSFNLLDKELDGHDMFFTSEEHGSTANAVVKLKFLKYFKKKANIKYLLMGLSHSDACFLNQYLNTGNEQILDEMYKPLKGTFAWNKDGYQLYKSIYKFNKSLPDQDKLVIVGIDIEHQFENAMRYMISLIPSNAPPAEIKPYLKELKSVYSTYTPATRNEKAAGLTKFFEKLKKSIENNRTTYTQYFGKKLFNFEFVNQNILNAIEAYSVFLLKNDKNFNEIRDKKMYENFVKLYPRLPEGKFFGQFGTDHVFQKPTQHGAWVASLMQGDDSPVKGRVLSIVCAYKNCMKMTKIGKKGYYSTDKWNTYHSSENVFDSYLATDFTLFRLSGNDSPFAQKLIWPMRFCDKPETGVTIDYYQYMVLVKNAKATDPLEQSMIYSGPVPTVASTVPACGDQNVDPGLKELSVTFNMEMLENCWAPCHSSKEIYPGTKPEICRFLDDKRTFMMSIALKPNTTYAIWINTEEYNGFRDVDGYPAKPFHLIFKTGDMRGKPIQK
jgi:hypothetical protein